MNDCISRQAVNDLISKFIIEIHTEGGRDLNAHTNDVLRQILRNINSDEVLPSVNPQEPKTGYWIEHEWKELREKGYYRCSVCNHGYQRYTKGIRKSDVPYIDGQEYTLWHIDNYCPNCGARMVEPQESEGEE